jgi:hypothetical protein
LVNRVMGAFLGRPGHRVGDLLIGSLMHGRSLTTLP